MVLGLVGPPSIDGAVCEYQSLQPATIFAGGVPALKTGLRALTLNPSPPSGCIASSTRPSSASTRPAASTRRTRAPGRYDTRRAGYRWKLELLVEGCRGAVCHRLLDRSRASRSCFSAAAVSTACPKAGRVH